MHDITFCTKPRHVSADAAFLQSIEHQRKSLENNRFGRSFFFSFPFPSCVCVCVAPRHQQHSNSRRLSFLSLLHQTPTKQCHHFFLHQFCVALPNSSSFLPSSLPSPSSFSRFLVPLSFLNSSSSCVSSGECLPHNTEHKDSKKKQNKKNTHTASIVLCRCLCCVALLLVCV